MNQFTILFLLEQLCDSAFILQLKQAENWQIGRELFENKLNVEQPITNISDSLIIAIRNFQCRLIQKNEESALLTLAQLEQLEEHILLMIQAIPFKDPINTKLKLIDAVLLDVKEKIKKMALLEIKQVIILLMTKLTIDEMQLNNLFKHIKINYRYFLGYDTMDCANTLYYQHNYQKDSPIYPIETKIEATIYNRMNKDNNKYNAFVKKHGNTQNIEMVNHCFQLWKKKIQGRSANKSTISNNLYFMVSSNAKFRKNL